MATIAEAKAWINNWRYDTSLPNLQRISFFVFNRLDLLKLLIPDPTDSSKDMDGIRFYLALDANKKVKLIAAGVKVNNQGDYTDCIYDNQSSGTILEGYAFDKGNDNPTYGGIVLPEAFESIAPPQPIPIIVAAAWINKYIKDGYRIPVGYDKPDEPKLRAVLFLAKEASGSSTVTHLQNYLRKPTTYTLLHIGTKIDHNDIPNVHPNELNTQTFIISGSNDSTSDVVIEPMTKENQTVNGLTIGTTTVLEFGTVCPPICGGTCC